MIKASVVGEGNESGQARETSAANRVKARRRVESRCQRGPEARSRRPRLSRLPRSHRGGLQQISLMVGVHTDAIIVSRGKNACEKFFAQLKERFSVKNQRELQIYTDCAFVRD